MREESVDGKKSANVGSGRAGSIWGRGKSLTSDV